MTYLWKNLLVFQIGVAALPLYLIQDVKMFSYSAPFKHVRILAVIKNLSRGALSVNTNICIFSEALIMLVSQYLETLLTMDTG